MTLETGLRADDIEHWVNGDVPIIMSDDMWPRLLEVIGKHRNVASDETEVEKIAELFELIEGAYKEAKRAPISLPSVPGKIIPFKGNPPPKPKLHVV